MTGEIRAELKNIRNVEVKSKVAEIKDHPPKVVTAVRFEFDGEPAQVQEILSLEAQGKPVNAELYSPQLAFAIDENGATSQERHVLGDENPCVRGPRVAGKGVGVPG